MKKDLDWANLFEPNKATALMLAKREISALVRDAAQLEGINFTLPEIQTLLDGMVTSSVISKSRRIRQTRGVFYLSLFSRAPLRFL